MVKRDDIYKLLDAVRHVAEYNSLQLSSELKEFKKMDCNIDLVKEFVKELGEGFSAICNELLKNGVVTKEFVDSIFGQIKEEKKLTFEEINAIMATSKNLFIDIPGRSIPKGDQDVARYADIQILRFIESGASDFIIETQKKDGMVKTMIRFRIYGLNYTQDDSGWHRYQEIEKIPEFQFFEKVRRNIGSTKGKGNADSKSIVHDTSFFILDRSSIMRSFRLNIMPTKCYDAYFPLYGMRLTTNADNISLDDLDILPFMRERLKNIARTKKAGLTLFTGPTSHGKSTTMYGVLNMMDKEHIGILSIENPIESQIYGVSQTEERYNENNELKYTLKQAFKGILRQPLDVIVPGELRDAEEIQLGVKTGLIGYKVISTLHTNGFVDTILRIHNEGVNKALIANGVARVSAQRLIRKLCPHCSQKMENSERILSRVKKAFQWAHIYSKEKLFEVLSDLGENDFDSLHLERALKKINTITEANFNGMIDLIDDNESKILSLPSKEEKIIFLLELFKDYPDPSLTKEIQKLLKKPDIRVASGYSCGKEKCFGGYSGRLYVSELEEFDKPIRDYIQDPDKKISELEEYLVNRGFIDMRKYAYIQMLQGKTSLEAIEEYL